ncbi:MAG: restriction endonuclease subunit S [Dethiobacter sp.]|nr:restriction endonuclease subunit S [Dethiobacter sp.]
MMRKYKRYDDYKDSGVEWIGEIPKHWLTVALKRSFKIVNGGTPKSNEPLFWDDGNVIWATPEDLSKNGSKYIEQSKRKISLQGVLNSSATVVPVNSLIISTRAPIGYIKIAAVSLSVNQGCKCLVRRNTLNEEFYYYFLLTAREELIALGQGSTFMELSNFNLANTNIVVVPLEEQKQISSYLNIKTSEIDALITDKEKLIELLKEQRQTIITEAVTKGLNPDVKMKDTGVEWIGEVPEKWKVLRLKLIAHLKSGDTITSNFIDDSGTYPVYGGNGLRGYTENYNYDGDFLLIGRQGALCGNIHFVQGQFWASEHAVVVSILKDNEALWLYFLLESMNLNQYSESAAQPGISVDKIKNLYISCPPAETQSNIARYLMGKCAEIKQTIEITTRIINKLKEYRQSLIYEAVTGKIDVRDWSDKPLERSDAVANA